MKKKGGEKRIRKEKRKDSKDFKDSVVKKFYHGIKNQDKSILAQAITLIESQNDKHRKMSEVLIQKILKENHSIKNEGKNIASIRIGISGVPGVGKSTFIDNFGTIILENPQNKLAVLAIDPSSEIKGGSILGDKTRMTELTKNERAFIRPTPSLGELGGVAGKTKEAMILCEAFGYNIIFIETVGVGQSETVVNQMVDLVLFLTLPGAGDDLQAMKKGIMEIVDMVIINKADGENQIRAKRAQNDFEIALNLPDHKHENHHQRKIPVILCSAIENKGLREIWEECQNLIKIKKKNLRYERKRKNQEIDWMWNILEDYFKYELYKVKLMKEKELNKIENKILNGSLTPYKGAKKILKYLKF